MIRARPIGSSARHELFRDPLRYPKDISRVFVVVAHECFTAQLTVVLRVIKPLRDLLLHVEMQNVGRPFGGVMQIGADTQKLNAAELPYYTTANGTSFSAPQVAGAIALPV